MYQWIVLLRIIQDVCELLYSFTLILAEEVFFTSEAKTLAYCLVFLDYFEILLFLIVKQSEFKPLMNSTPFNVSAV